MPLLFSYGTLQQEAVQLSTFGRRLRGEPDELVGFEQSVFRIADPEFVATSGKADHAIVRFTGRPDRRVKGTVLEVTERKVVGDSDGQGPPGVQALQRRELSC